MTNQKHYLHRWSQYSNIVHHIFSLLAGLVLVFGLSSPLPAVATNSPFPETWIDGTSDHEPNMQVQRYDPNTFVIRQSVRTNFEAPFIFLLFGNNKAFLLDTGAEGLNIRPTIDGIIATWLKAHHRRSISLIIAHSHNHRDHRAGDGDFANRPETTLVGLKIEDVAKFFGIPNWPNGVGHLDLGGRVLEILPTPGHQNAHIMIYDRRTRLLLSGDALYPGRLTIPLNHWSAELASIDRIVTFTKLHPVSYILGAHIEMTNTPRVEIPGGASIHANEHRLELSYQALLDLQAGLRAMHGMPLRQVHADFIVEPVPARPD